MPLCFRGPSRVPATQSERAFDRWLSMASIIREQVGQPEVIVVRRLVSVERDGLTERRNRLFSVLALQDTQPRVSYTSAAFGRT